MKRIIWKLIYRIIRSWEESARKNGLDAQVIDCIQIQIRMEHYADAMARDGIWE